MTSERAGSEPHWRAEIPLAVALLFGALAYAPVVRNSFHSDDFYHLYDLVNSSFAQFFVRTHGGHIYLFRNLVFYLCYRLFRTEPFLYYGLAFVTHIFNVFLVYRIVRGSTGSARLACFGSVLWGTLPAHEGVIGWYSVFGHALAATFALVPLYRITAIAAGGAPIRFEPLLWALAALIGATCFGVGLGLAAAMPIAAWLLLPPSPLRNRAFGVLALVVLLLPPLYVGVERLDGALHGEPAENATRLLGMLIHWPKHLLLLVHLFIFAASSLVLGTFRAAAALGALDYALAAALALFCAALFFASSGAARRKAAAFMILAAAAYALIALGRGQFVETGGPGSVAAAPRFHYVGTCMMVLALCVLLADAGRARMFGPRIKTGLLVAWLAIVLRGLQTGQEIDHHRSNQVEVEQILTNIRAAASATPAGGDVYVENHKFMSIGPFLANDPRFPGWGAVFAIYFPDGWIDGRRVRFVQSDTKALETARGGRVSADLFVRPEDVPLAARLTDQPRPRRPERARVRAPSQRLPSKTH